uniref:ARID domain-containing protein n=1 Tax=Kalanchoe fedtschenkoi TaxID=63787 RepID=A0A7N0T1Q8_KALFE
MDLKVEENKQHEDPTHEAACVGNLIGEEETKVDQLLSASLGIEHAAMNLQQVDSTEKQIVESNVVAPVNDDKQDFGENDEIQIDGIAAIDADKESVLVQAHLESHGDGNRVEPNHDVDGQAEGVGEKEFPPQEELHLDESMFPASEEMDASDSLPVDFSQGVADVTAVVDENTGLEHNGTNGCAMGMTNQLACVADEKDMETKGGPQVGDVLGFDKSSGLVPFVEGDEAGTEEEQMAFMKDVESFCREKGLEFKPPKFYGEGLNLLKLWRAVIRLGGYEQVTACKLWRQVGESFNPPK